MAAPWLSAAKSVTSGPKTSGPIDASFGPWPVCVTCKADDEESEARATNAITSPSFTGRDLIFTAPFERSDNLTPTAGRRQERRRCLLIQIDYVHQRGH